MRLWDVEFLGTEGAIVTANKEHLANYSVFINHNSGKRTVIVANGDYDECIQVHVEIVDSRSKMTLATPEYPDPVSTDGTCDISPLSAAVFMEK